ncbi:DUF2634 domain-containing protein [Levilactobacillus brevis]|uniref:DUF2634 domain-containing protein n=1 Tax=Levilactobacillus brevis (strain ATCC 367 / BCRC 12310 / CIP 105137 / JCM 1170 / LMG 11437 / NCIMB 947 / NCTC 947) TaxID=387344 RepID=Q03RF7_LEVBA|nr:DUF2634 domain-containing protein [Levilactobacillus brevis]ABJ64215.1 hypothetical protein LVIS_1083 [Levilactobacillus brevis ATCC 367]ARW50536.1 hypothetical protein S101106_01053 [Levilactobacillus brevis]MCS8597069.1 DUF2634 domain-containing protein [Levilactobacillus brevis]MCT2887258.1 DUF2634 domain-containing protein [Levilactobacillus brevis]MDM7552608.1 DUF2634 domain-containing protein [Levilactobacillus brevis]
MRDFKLDKNGDVIIDDGDIAMISDNEEISQRIATTLRTRLNEFEPVDEPMGLTRENALGKGYNQDFLQEDIEDAISTQVDENIDVQEINFTKSDADRSLSVEVKYMLPNGDVETVQTNLGDDDQ